MKLVALALALLAATAAGQAPPACKYYDAIATVGVDNQATSDQVSLCNVTCPANAKLPSYVEARNQTQSPLALVTNGSPKCEFLADEVQIVFTESLKYFGKLDGDKPEILFGTCEGLFQGIITSATYTVENGEGSACQRRWTIRLKWSDIVALGSSTPASNCAYKRLALSDADGDYIRYEVAFAIRNHEYFDFSRPSSTSPIIEEREIVHALPFQIDFRTTASISTTIQAFAQIAEIAAITRQEVSVAQTFDGDATMTLNLFTSVQAPFIIDEVRFDNGASGSPSNVAGVDGDEHDNGIADSVGIVQFGPLENPRQDYDLLAVGFSNVANAAEGEDVLCNSATGNSCNQRWKFVLKTPGNAVPASRTCTFLGVYRVRYTVRCHDDVNTAGNCPINLYGSTGKRFVYGSWDLSVQSSNHCPQVVATVSLDSDLYTHPSPTLSFSGAQITATGHVSNFAGTGLPQPDGTNGYDHPNAYDFTASKFDAVPAGWTTAASSKDDFLQNQFVFGVARTVIGEATVVTADFSSLTITHPSGASTATVPIINADGFNPGFDHSSSTYGALQFGRVKDTTKVRGGTNKLKGGVAYPYFFFKIDTTTLNIDDDDNKPVSLSGVVLVTYESAGQQSLGAELQTTSRKFSLSTLQTANGQRFQSSISVGGSGSSAGSGAAASEATVLGLSANVAAGAALAAGLVVGVLVGVLAMTLLSRPAAPKRSESQVQLTGTAV